MQIILIVFGLILATIGGAKARELHVPEHNSAVKESHSLEVKNYTIDKAKHTVSATDYYTNKNGVGEYSNKKAK